MGRLGRWVDEKKLNRVQAFLNETNEYMNELEKTNKSDKFISTFRKFKERFINLKNNSSLDEEWAEEALTWANILTHRAKLA